MFNSDTHQEEQNGSQNFDSEKHTIDHRFCRCRRLTMRLLPLSNADWGSPFQLRAHGLISWSLWTYLLTQPTNHLSLQLR